MSAGARDRAATALAVFVASFGYAGYAPTAPGTVGSAAALVLYAVLRILGLAAIEIELIIVLFVAGLWAATRTARHVGTEDPGIVVIDEVVGMLVTVAFVPVGFVGAVLGFLAFRVFDIIKPFPAADSERLPGGLGIMVDDVIAGLYAQLTLRLVAWVFPGWVLA